MKKMKKFLAILLSACMAVGVFGSIAMADTVSDTVHHADGSYTVTETTTSTSTDPVTGEPVVFIEIVKSTYDANNNLIERIVDGESHTSYEPDKNLPEVTVPLTPGTPTSGNVDPSEASKVEGPIDNIPGGSTPNNSDYSTTTSTFDREVTVNAGEVTVESVESKANIESVGPQLDPLFNEDGTPVLDANGNPVYEDKVGIWDSETDKPFAGVGDPSSWVMPEGADVRYVGRGQLGSYPVVGGMVKYERDEDGKILVDEEGNPYFSIVHPGTGEPFAYVAGLEGKAEHLTKLPEGWETQLELSSQPTIFKLMDKDGNISYAYCMDFGTSAIEKAYYTVSNLEDIDYYASEDAEAQIRTIVTNGYWGTSDLPKEDGTYNDGSLASIIAKIKADVEAARATDPDYGKVTVYQRDENGRPILVDGKRVPLDVVDILDVIDELSAGEAMNATQAAIWSFSNGSKNALPDDDGFAFLSVDSFYNYSTANTNFNLGEVLGKEGEARLNFLYEWLINLPDEEEPNPILDENNNIKNMTITVKDKVEGHENNLDENEDNDVYNTELNFQLAFIPGPDDDLIVILLDAGGNPIKDGNDQVITRRLSGTKQEGEEYITEENGVYTLTGLQLSENSNFTFNIKLKGVQHLEKGVYVYAPIGGREVSQTFVGMGEGEKNVDVTVGMTITFDVDENNNVVADREWYSKQNWTFTPDTPTTPPGEVIPPNDTPLSPTPDGEVIEDEDVPLAGLPNTGDASNTMLYLAIAAGAALILLAITAKRNRKSEN